MKLGPSNRLLMASALLVGSGALAATDFSPSGEVRLRQSSAAFSDARIVAPNADLSLRADGSWDGRVFGQPVDLQIEGDRISGAWVNLRVVERADGVEVLGMWMGQSVRMEVDPEAIRLRVGRRSVTFLGGEGGIWRNPSVAQPTQELQLLGDAQRLNGAIPQFVLALLVATMDAARYERWGGSAYLAFGPPWRSR